MLQYSPNQSALHSSVSLAHSAHVAPGHSDLRRQYVFALFGLGFRLGVTALGHAASAADVAVVRKPSRLAFGRLGCPRLARGVGPLGICRGQYVLTRLRFGRGDAARGHAAPAADVAEVCEPSRVAFGRLGRPGLARGAGPTGSGGGSRSTRSSSPELLGPLGGTGGVTREDSRWG